MADAAPRPSYLSKSRFYTMDFETLGPAIPRFPGMRPFDAIAFQWAVDVVPAPGAAAVHHEFLATDAGDPRRRFLETLARAVGERGTIVVYNAAFESGRLAERAAWIRDLAAETERIRDRLWDLLPVVRRHVDHPAFLGSFGLKRVLPAIAALGYEHLAVQGGSDAGAAWDRLVRGAPEPAEAARLEQAPRADCRQDSAGLLDLIRRLTALAEGREIRA